jgi:hypothetical protein
MDKKILSIDADDDDLDVKSFYKFTEEHSERSKNKTANEFLEIGDKLLAEIEEKNKRREKQKVVFINYILRHSDRYSFKENELLSYSYEDVRDIYNQIKDERNVFKKLFRFIFNL